MKRKVNSFFLIDDGVTSIEYALIAGIVVVGIAGFLPSIVSSLTGIFQVVADGFR